MTLSEVRKIQVRFLYLIFHSLLKFLYVHVAPIASSLVQEHLLPLLLQIHVQIPAAIPTLYPPKILNKLKLPESFDIGDLQTSDSYFDTFYYQLSDIYYSRYLANCSAVRSDLSLEIVQFGRLSRKLDLIMSLSWT